MNTVRQPPAKPRRFRRVKAVLLCAAALVAGVVTGSVVRSRFRPAPPDVSQSTASPVAAAHSTAAAPGTAESAGARFHSMAERQAAWRERILHAAETDPDEAVRLFLAMPFTVAHHGDEGDIDPMAELLGELFAAQGPPALEAALRAGVDVPLCFEALARAKSVTSAIPFLEVLLRQPGRDSAPLAMSELNRVMRFLGRANVTDSEAAWRLVAPHAELAKLDRDRIRALAAMARGWGADGMNLPLAEAVIASLPRPWDASRLRQGLLGDLAQLRGRSPELRDQITAALGGEPGATQAKEFAKATATRMTFQGGGGGAEGIAWASSQTDPVERAAALDGALGYLHGVSRFRPLKVVLSDPALRADPALLERVVRMAAADGAPPGDRDIGDVMALRDAAAADADTASVLRRTDLAPYFR